MTEHQFTTPKPVRLDLTIAAGEIEVATVDGQESTVTLEGSPKLIEAMRVELIGDQLVIQSRRKSIVGWFGRLEQSVHVQVRIPHDSRIEITTASADAALDGRFGDLEMKSASGGVTVTGELGGDARIQTVSGDVRLPRVAGDLSANSVSASIAADSVDGSVVAKSVSGDVRVGVLHEGSVNVQSVSGDVELGIASGTRVDVDAKSASGDLSSEVPLTDAPSSEDGPTVVIRGNTVSGDFRVARAA
jgi:hypothetical protein